MIFVYFFVRLIETIEDHAGYCFAELSKVKVTLPAFLGPFLNGSKEVEMNILEHMGLVVPHDAAFHDFHHTRNVGNFGWPILDYLHGTMDVWVSEGGLAGYLRSKAAEGHENTQKAE
jgi:hypothetical protein